MPRTPRSRAKARSSSTQVRKICAHCGRVITPRRMSTTDWAQLRYCSAACRRQAGARVHRELETVIRELLAARGPSSSICPSDAARRVFPDTFREHMEDARRAARRLAHADEIVITQKGRPVDPTDFRGPVRLGRGPAFEGPNPGGPNSSGGTTEHEQ